jgi:hypothetical protein
VQETAPNKFKPVTVEEVKGGAADQPTRAMGQATRMVQSLGQVATGGGDVRAFELNQQHKVTADWTASLDLSTVDQTSASTRGPQGKGFAKNLPYDAEVLLEVAKSILKDGLPPKSPPPTLPPLPRPKEKKDVEPAGR